MALLFLTALQLGVADPGDPFVDLPDGKRTVALAPGEVAAPGRTKAADWSPTGDALLIDRVEEGRPAAWARSRGLRPLEGPVDQGASGEVRVWDRRTGRSTLLWRYDPEGTAYAIAKWMANGRFVFLDVTSTDRRQKLMLFSSSGGRPVVLNDSTAAVGWAVSATEPFGVVAHQDQGAGKRSLAVRAFGPNGSLGPEASLDFPGETLRGFGLQIAKDGRHALLMVAPEGPIEWVPEGPGFIRGASAAAQFQSALHAGEVSVSLAGVSLGHGITDRTAIWLSLAKAGPRLLVTTDGEAPTLSPDGRAVAYRHDGTLLVRQLVTFDRQAVEGPRRSAAQARAMAVCHAAADAIGSLAGHEKLPTVGAFDEAVALRFPGARGFVYAPGHEGEAFAWGSVSVYGGRAVLRADLTPEWIPKK